MSDLIVPGHNNGNVPDGPMHRRLSGDITCWVETALAACAQGERVTWDVALTLVPTPQGPQPGYAFLVQMASPMLGQNFNHFGVFGLDGLGEQSVAGVVREAVEAMRRQRSQMLTGGGS